MLTSVAGMNDVLPKPFTKEGLLNMLEKHLSHLKKQPLGMGAPAPPGALTSAKRGMKAEDSPSTSPATASNWNSPGGLPIVSPSSSNNQDDPYMQAIHNNAGPAPGPGPYSVQTPITPATMYHPSPGGPMAAPPRNPPGAPILQGPPPQHRRGISDISGGVADMGGDAKRQQMYAPQPPGMQMPPQPMQPQGLPPQMRPPGR